MTHRMRMGTLLMCEIYFKRRPILLMKTDGAQDEAPRFPKTLATIVDLFHLLDLHVLLHGVNAAGLSAFNPVERRMTPLFHDLPGIVLLYDHFGNHLDSSGKTIDHEWRRRIFKRQLRCFRSLGENTD